MDYNDYNEEIHAMINEFAVQLLVKNFEWLFMGDKVIYQAPINSFLAEVITISNRGVLRDYLIRHENGVAEAYLARPMKIDDDPLFEWHKIPEENR